MRTLILALGGLLGLFLLAPTPPASAASVAGDTLSPALQPHHASSTALQIEGASGPGPILSLPRRNDGALSLTLTPQDAAIDRKASAAFDAWVLEADLPLADDAPLGFAVQR